MWAIATLQTGALGLSLHRLSTARSTAHQILRLDWGPQQACSEQVNTDSVPCACRRRYGGLNIASVFEGPEGASKWVRLRQHAAEAALAAAVTRGTTRSGAEPSAHHPPSPCKPHSLLAQPCFLPWPCAGLCAGGCS